MPDEPEVLGLLALMLLHDAAARRPGRTTPATWCRWRTRTARAGTERRSTRALALLDAALRRGRAGPYQVQAAIAACHATAADAADTDWAADRRAVRRAGRSGALRRSSSSTGRSRSRWPTARPPGWSWSTQLDGGRRLAGYHLLPATRADLLRRLGPPPRRPPPTARRSSCAPTDAERRYLTRRLAEVTGHRSSPARACGRGCRSAAPAALVRAHGLLVPQAAVGEADRGDAVGLLEVDLDQHPRRRCRPTAR